MKKFLYILLLLTLASCVTQKNSTHITSEENYEKDEKALQRSKEKFMNSDSAQTIICDLG